MNKLWLLRGRRRPQLAQQIHCGRQRKLGGAEAGHKIPAANAPALFQRLEHVIHCAESARNILSRHMFPQQHSVAIEEL